MKKPRLRLVREALVELDVVELESVSGGQSGWVCVGTSVVICISKSNCGPSDGSCVCSTPCE